MFVVTGATGNTGSVVVNYLLSKGQKVRAVGRNAERLKTLAVKGAEPFVGDVADASAMTKAFTGAKAVYVMIPPDMKSQNFRDYQDRVTAAFATALEDSRVGYAVSLSSVGADKPEKTGPVVGLYHLEQRLNRIESLNVLHLRAGYFMENTLAQIELIRAHGIAAGPLRPDLMLPMIAARDVGAVAADEILKLDFRKQQTHELLGHRDIGMSEAVAIIGKVIGKPNLNYVQLPDDQVRAAMIQSGLTEDLANLILEMAAALNSGYMRPLEQRSARNTTPTSFETFVAEVLAPLYERASAAG